MDGMSAVETVIERVDGGPFTVEDQPEANGFHFDVSLINRTENRVTFACVTCDAGVVLLGVVSCGTVTCHRCHRPMHEEKVA